MPQRLINTRASKDTVHGPTAADIALAGDQPLTARGGSLALTPVLTAVPGASIAAPAIPANRNYTITYSVELDIAAGLETEVTANIFDGVAGAGIDTFHQTVGISGGEGTVQQVISWTLVVAGNGAARTFGMGLSDPASVVAVPANGCRGVVQIH